MKSHPVALAVAVLAGVAIGAFVSTAGAENGVPTTPTPTIVPVGVSGGGNFAWFLNGRTVWSCTAGAGSASPPVCNKGTLPP